MSVSWVGGGSAAAATVALPAGAQAGDVVVVLGLGGVFDPPSLPVGWTNLGSNTLGGARVGWKVLDADDVSDGSVTWAGSEDVLCGVYRGVDSVVAHGNTGGTSTGASIGIGGHSDLPDGAWAVDLLMHRGASNARDRTFAGWVTRSAAFASGRLGLWDSGAPVSDIEGGSAGVDGDDYSWGAWNYLTEYVPPPPVADFDADALSGEAPLTVQFADESTGAPTSWEWAFGDGTEPSTEQHPSHEFSLPGTYSVVLEVTGPGGSDSTSASVIVAPMVPTERPPWDAALNPTATPQEVALYYRRMGWADKDVATELGKRAFDAYERKLHSKARLFWRASVLAHQATATSRFYAEAFTSRYGMP